MFLIFQRNIVSSRVEGSKQNTKCSGQLEIHKSVGPVAED